MNQNLLGELRNLLEPDRIFENEPMKRHTTFRVGGAADILVCPPPECLPQIIRLCREHGQDYYIVGNGSNLLVGDKGIRGLVIEMTSQEEDISIQGDKIKAGAGMLLSRTANRAAKHGLAGMEFAAGIPGTIGGAVVMNAGAYGGEMKDIIESVTVLDAEGNEKELRQEDLELGYRKSCILKNGYIVTKAVLKLSRGNEQEINARMAELREKRLEKQPLEFPSAGSTFKRPNGHYAGKLIMDAGLKGYQVGGAQVSEKHCGFVINKNEATAKDICQLIHDVSEKVKQQFGVTLEPEVKMIGEFE